MGMGRGSLGMEQQERTSLCPEGESRAGSTVVEGGFLEGLAGRGAGFRKDACLPFLGKSA